MLSYDIIVHKVTKFVPQYINKPKLEIKIKKKKNFLMINNYFVFKILIIMVIHLNHLIHFNFYFIYKIFSFLLFLNSLLQLTFFFFQVYLQPPLHWMLTCPVTSLSMRLFHCLSISQKTRNENK